MQFVDKINQKIVKSVKTVTRSMFEEQKKEPTRWIIAPENSATSPRQFNEALAKINMRAVLLPTEDLNQTLNNARAIWPYLAQVWEKKVLQGTLMVA